MQLFDVGPTQPFLRLLIDGVPLTYAANRLRLSCRVQDPFKGAEAVSAIISEVTACAQANMVSHTWTPHFK